jgi:hypothetical protein
VPQTPLTQLLGLQQSASNEQEFPAGAHDGFGWQIPS